jgi:hypothetical protein
MVGNKVLALNFEFVFFSYFLLSFFNFVLYDNGISGGGIVRLMGQSVYLVAGKFRYKVLAVCISTYCQ